LFLTGSGFPDGVSIRLYNAVFVKPFVYLARVNKNDAVDRVYEGVVKTVNFFNTVFAQTQNGVMRWYIMGIVIGAIFILSLGLIIG
jgi:NADH-quinone oxidoreductase subunit L